MHTAERGPVVGRCLVFVLFAASACAPPDAVTRRVPPPSPRAGELHASTDLVRSIQLYGADERQLPIYGMQSGAPLTLEFDLMNWEARPLSIYFYHADRRWKRDLYPSEYLSRFDRDDLMDYALSRGPLVHYTHYEYRFPNGSIDFRLSGNYILRVTEQGREDAVLFEVPFMVSEESTTALMRLSLHMVGSQGLPALQPTLNFLPPEEVGAAFQDLAACFLEGGRLLVQRCTDRASLMEQPALIYYLEPEESFRSRIGDYLIDLRTLQPHNDVERIDRTTTPIAVGLVPDYARFPDSHQGFLLRGQSIIGGNDRFADTQAEYVEATFTFVPPDEQPLPGGLYITGSFNRWHTDLSAAMRWSADQRQYTTSMLIKQGAYEYRYTSPDPAVQRRLHVRLARPDQWYTGLVYYRDLRVNTDRLLTTTHVLSR